MTSTSHSHMSSERPPIRLPKLSYRNNSSDTESFDTVPTNVSRMTTSTNPTSALHSTFCPSPEEPFIDMLSPTLRSPSIVPSSTGSTDPRTPNNPIKKKAGLLNGLFAKEPSAQALVDYQKHLLKQSHHRTRPVGLPGVSSAKLPPTVPKVNSKWDGIPQTVKERERQKQEHRLSMSGRGRNASAVRSIGSDLRSTTSASHRRPSRGTLGSVSTHSSVSSNRLADLYGWEGTTLSSSSSTIVDFAAEHRPATARMQTSHSAPAAPESQPTPEGTLLFPHHDTRNPLASFPSYFDRSPSSLPGSPYPPSHSHSPALTPLESSPVTPDGPSPMKVPPCPLVEARPQDDIKTTVVEAPASANEVIIKSAGFNILGPPATAKRRPKATPCQSGSVQPCTSGSDKHLNSILKKATPNDTSPRPTLSSYLLSPDSAASAGNQSPSSARNRLGLGMSVNIQAVAPWSSPDQSREAVEGERMITPTPEGGQSLKRKGRMSLFKK